MSECWLSDSCKKLHCNDENGCIILYKLNYLFDQACISEKQRRPIALWAEADGTDLEEFKQLRDIQINIMTFISEGKQLYLHSVNSGTGKTSWSLKLMQAYFKKIWLKTELKCRGLFVSVPSFLLALKDNISNKNDYYQHIKSNILEADLIIWDDIGTKVGSSFEIEHLLSLIDLRINLGKANIFTSNLSRDELRVALGDRLASRICNLGYDIEFKGGDKRSVSRPAE